MIDLAIKISKLLSHLEHHVCFSLIGPNGAPFQIYDTVVVDNGHHVAGVLSYRVCYANICSGHNNTQVPVVAVLRTEPGS